MKILTALLFLFLSVPASAGMLTPFIEEKIEVTPGREYMLGSGRERSLRVKNTGKSEIEVRFEVMPARTDDLDEGYVPLPDTDWIEVPEEPLQIAPDEWGEAEIRVNIPSGREYYEKKYGAAIVTISVAGPGRVETALRSRLLIETTPREGLWRRIRGIFGL